MKVQIIKNGRISIVLIPEEGDDIEIATLREISKSEVDITFKEGQSPFITGNLHDILIISPKQPKKQD